eukprot:SAG11_NODE_218_length_12212_cov_7.026005_12_plen_78_part_00
MFHTPRRDSFHLILDVVRFLRELFHWDLVDIGSFCGLQQCYVEDVVDSRLFGKFQPIGYFPILTNYYYYTTLTFSVY